MFDLFLIDLDGTVYRGTELIPGADHFIAELRRRRHKYLFLTNNSTRTPTKVAQQLKAFGLPCTAREVFTSARATAQCVAETSVYCIGESGLTSELKKQGCILRSENVENVVVGLDRKISYSKIATASRLIREGAKFVATNPDKMLETESGIMPGNGSILAAITAASGQEPVVIGKPNKHIILTALQHLKTGLDKVVIVGDNIETDIAAANNAGIRSILLLTGISQASDIKNALHTPTWQAKDYKELLWLMGMWKS